VLRVEYVRLIFKRGRTLVDHHRTLGDRHADVMITIIGNDARIRVAALTPAEPPRIDSILSLSGGN